MGGKLNVASMKNAHQFLGLTSEISTKEHPEQVRILATYGIIEYYAAMSHCWAQMKKDLTAVAKLQLRAPRCDYYNEELWHEIPIGRRHVYHKGFSGRNSDEFCVLSKIYQHV